MEKKNCSELTVRMFGKFQTENEKGILNKENMRLEMLTRFWPYMISHRRKRYDGAGAD